VNKEKMNEVGGSSGGRKMEPHKSSKEARMKMKANKQNESVT